MKKISVLVVLAMFILTTISFIKPAHASLLIDGFCQVSNNPSPATCSLTTTNTNDVLIAMVVCHAAGTQSITITGLTFNLRTPSLIVGDSNYGYFEYWSIAQATLTGATVTFACTGGFVGGGQIVAINGANLINPFDANAGFPYNAVANSGNINPISTSVTSNNANDILLEFVECNCSPTGVTQTLGFTMLSQQSPPALYQAVAYNVVSSTVTNQPIGFSSSTNGFQTLIVDAVQLAGTNSNSGITILISDTFHLIESISTRFNVQVLINEFFHFAESFIQSGGGGIINGITVTIKDAFSFMETICIITYSCQFITSTNTFIGTPQVYVINDNPIDFFVTAIAIPLAVIVGMIVAMKKGANISEEMVLPTVLFTLLMIAWGGNGSIFPSWVSLIVILVCGGGLSYFIGNYFYGRMRGNSE